MNPLLVSCILPNQIIPTNSTFAGELWPGLPAVVFTLPMKFSKINATLYRFISVLFKTVVSKSKVTNGQLDTLIVATSNNAEFARFLEEKEQAPIIDRCRLSYMAHNTNYRLQQELTSYAIGSLEKTTFSHEKLHVDPTLNYAISVFFHSHQDASFR